jgi:GNAT superfamily N-acetyltransferase
VLKVKFSIRQAGVKDLPVLMSMMRKYLAEVEHLTMDDEKFEKAQLSILKGIVTQSVMVLLIEGESKRRKTIGYGVFDLRPNIFGDLIAWGHHFFVEPSFRNSNVAEESLQFAESMARRAGATEFYIDTARPEIYKRRLGYTDKYVVVAKSLEEK